jgi:hypothetical protein
VGEEITFNKDKFDAVLERMIEHAPANATVFETADLCLGSCWAFASRSPLS